MTAVCNYCQLTPSVIVILSAASMGKWLTLAETRPTMRATTECPATALHHRYTLSRRSWPSRTVDAATDSTHGQARDHRGSLCALFFTAIWRNLYGPEANFLDCIGVSFGAPAPGGALRVQPPAVRARLLYRGAGRRAMVWRCGRRAHLVDGRFCA